MSHSKPVTMAFRIEDYDQQAVATLYDIYVDISTIVQLAIACCLQLSHAPIYYFIDTYYQNAAQVSDDEDFDRWELKANYILDTVLVRIVIHFEIMFKEIVGQYTHPFNLTGVHSVTVNGGIAYVKFNTTPM